MRLGKDAWCVGACAAVVGVLGLVPSATAAPAFKSCGRIVGNEHVIAMKVEASGLSCEAAAKAIKSPKTPAQLGYRCVVRTQPPLRYFTCERKAGGLVRFREALPQGK
jgi:hypothetical protein